ncbi:MULTISPECIES: hypothetical protein [unclassified Caballeronia]|uniref:hypothetical protein n=1 Tax=unclassified Caballeronia TaxID=2646786 RepID=UPI0028668CF7|nr:MULTISPECIES: hypothetical protein [unclassified Caballeronia]MDR5777364.1 hypothetical protein [Caballeronia sp. LZ002]MDR5802536.1 hypothetical protein [Caballeronia sp. LZ001]MDR5852802.1 hypothetical protein [Caballeronia sp. LZ003]
MIDDAEKRKGGGAKTSRSETVTVRLEPRLRYLAELAGRKQRRTLSSFIEWAILESLERVNIDDGGPNHNSESIAEASSRLWDVDEEDRFAKLALHFPELLTHDEQVLWKLVKENGYLWKGRYARPNLVWTWSTDEASLIFERLREHWAVFNAVARGERPRTDLPSWNRIDPTKAGDPDPMDDDIPF